MTRPLPRRSPQFEALVALLRERNLTRADLARISGVTLRSIQVHVASPRYERRTYKIEKALGVPIWTDQKRFDDLRRASDFLGTDFVLTKFHPLRSAAVAKGVRHTRAVTRKDALLVLVLEHLTQLENQTSK